MDILSPPYLAIRLSPVQMNLRISRLPIASGEGAYVVRLTVMLEKVVPMGDKKKKDDTEQTGSGGGEKKSLTVRDLSVVATELRQHAREINAKVERLEKSQSITQRVLDLEFTI